MYVTHNYVTFTIGKFGMLLLQISGYIFQLHSLL